MFRYVSVAEMIAIERAADAGGLSYAQMMDNAGLALAESISVAYSHIENKNILALVGKGNNGGDALVALAALAALGWQTSAYLAAARPDDPLVARLAQAGGKIYTSPDADAQLGDLVTDAAVLVDGLLGTGIKLPLRPPMDTVLAAVKEIIAGLAVPPAVVAVDCPSGVDCDSGAAAAVCLPADLTVCMAAVKHGLLKFPAFSLVGELQVVEIGLPSDLPVVQAIKRVVVDLAYVDQVLPPRPLDGHKGTFGTTLVVAGSSNYTGAALLAGRAAYRSGAGLVTLAVPAPLHTALAGHFPEATWLLLPDAWGGIAAEAAELLADNLGRATAILLGPGFGLQPPTAEFMAALFDKDTPLASLPTVIDADGLKLLANIPNWPTHLPPETILTPHPGEMAVLTGQSKEDLQADRLTSAESYARQWGHVVVLKGAFTVIAHPDSRTAIIPVASPALARAGTGDVLAGMIAGLRGQGMPAFEAAAAGAWLHAHAGLAAAQRLGGTAGVLAGDLIEELPKLLAD